MHLLAVNYPAIEFPTYRYNDDRFQIINVPPLQHFSKNAPEINEVYLKSSYNPAIVESLQRYAGNVDDVQKYAKRKPMPKKVINYERFERTSEQANAILFQTIYFTILFVSVIMWLVLFRR